MRSKNGGNSLLHRCVEVYDHRTAGLKPLESRVILFLELPIDFVNRQNGPGIGSSIHLCPNRWKDIRRIVSKQVENTAGIDAVGQLSSLVYQFETTVIALDFGKMFDSDLQVIRYVAGSDVFTIEILNDEIREKRTSA